MAESAPQSPPEIAEGEGLSATVIEVVFPENENHHGTLFGGACLSVMDKAAYVVASRRARSHIVLAGCDSIKFYRPVRSGQTVEATATVTKVGKSSITVSIEVIAEVLTSGERYVAATGQFSMVAVDAQGTPITLGPPGE